MSMFGVGFGTWWVSSKLDPRWNRDGCGYGVALSGTQDDMEKWLNECKEKYGDPPADTVTGFMKD